MRRVLRKLLILLVIILCVSFLFVINFPYGVMVVVVDAPMVKDNEKKSEALLHKY